MSQNEELENTSNDTDLKKQIALAIYGEPSDGDIVALGSCEEVIDVWTYNDEVAAILNLIRNREATLIREAKIQLLETITSPHYDNFHKTYDFDGIAEDTLTTKNELTNQQKGEQ